MNIPFNKVHLIGEEEGFIHEVLLSGELTGEGRFSSLCTELLAERYGFHSMHLTHSCTGALEMASLLLGLKPGDEIIAPSFTYVSSVNPFVLRGAKIVFADSLAHHPNVDPAEIEKLVNPRTRAIVVVHYGGLCCDMDRVLAIASAHGIPVIEDAAHAMDSELNQRPAGSFGALAAFSFHSTKNITCGEGGLLVVNDPVLRERAEILIEKGTNRKRFLKGEVSRYEWVDIGSSYTLSEMQAAFLYAQLRALDDIQEKRKAIWNTYARELSDLPERFGVDISSETEINKGNAHIFHLVTRNAEERRRLAASLHESGIAAASHYGALHQSHFYAEKHDGRVIPNAVKYEECLLRLPVYYSLTEQEAARVAEKIRDFFS